MYFNYIILIFFGSIINFVYNAYPSNVSIINNNVSDAPQDLRVEIFDEFGNINDDNSHDSVLKFNISWLPPYSWCPTSYSIFINSMTVDQKNTISCPEESIFYTTTTTTTDDNLFNIVLPENSLLSDVPELQIRPSCTYEIQVFANPRANANSNAAKINITVPNCIGKLCNCDEASKLLPSVEVNASIADSKSILISWSTIHQLLNASDISSFIVGYSIPILISKNGIPVYNLTKLTSAPSNARSYIWHTESSVNSIFDKEMKIFVAAEDIHGCRGRMSDYIIKTNAQPLLMSITYSNQWLIWSTVLIICSIIIGLFTYIRNRGHENYKFILSNHVTSGISSIRISERNGWINTVLKKKNMLYADEIIETTETITDGYEISYDRIKISSELGKGQFGKVYLGYLDFVTNNNNNNEGEENGFPVAVKMMNPGNVDDKTAARRQLVYEIGTMKRAGSHPHLVKLIGCCTKLENPICIILEYVEGGDLLGYLHQLRDSLNKKLTSTHSTSELCSNENCSNGNCKHSKQSGSLITDSFSISSLATNSITPEDNNNHSYTPNVTYENSVKKNIHHSTTGGTVDNYRFINFAMDIARGMEYLEQKYIVHRDLAARNILVTSNLKLKISDFGLSRDGIYVIGQSGNGVRRLPVRWMAPEALRDRAFTFKSDVWSYGVVLWEILTLGAFPYAEIQDDKLLQYIVMNNCRLKCPDNISPEFYYFLQSCWSTEPSKRPNFHQISHQLTVFSADFSTSIYNPSYNIVTL
ncbi:receptor-like tyrosine-protein kinase kin-15 isoform X1 [Cotesia glomerata]|uniref:receptor-like tyrosine-protein kinase kin-15 isoform X1 n=1 Tax=Cotesia glomerata TaxID=32391 RepID=UPI001D014AE6|nr:receptor-like tyrosine-protein kinase kin-15 isoform X1 [Cotesia glomerata]